MSHKLAQNFMSPSLACGLLGITGNNKGEMQPPRHGSNVGCSPTMCQIGVWHSRNQGQPRLDDGTPHLSALPPSLPPSPSHSLYFPFFLSLPLYFPFPPPLPLPLSFSCSHSVGSQALCHRTLGPQKSHVANSWGVWWQVSTEAGPPPSTWVRQKQHFQQGLNRHQHSTPRLGTPEMLFPLGCHTGGDVSRDCG